MAIELTETAVRHIISVAAQRQNTDSETSILRFGVKGGGCSGLSYFVDFVPFADKKDKQFVFAADNKQLIVVVDMKSYLFLNGTVIDWESTLMHSGFIFKNPAAKSSCGCGESFAP